MLAERHRILRLSIRLLISVSSTEEPLSCKPFENYVYDEETK